MKNIKKITLLGLACSCILWGCGSDGAGTAEGAAGDGSTEIARGETDVTADGGVADDGSVGTSGGEENQGAESFVTRAMVLRDPSGGLYFVGTDNGSFFTATMPRKLRDLTAVRLRKKIWAQAMWWTSPAMASCWKAIPASIRA